MCLIANHLTVEESASHALCMIITTEMRTRLTLRGDNLGNNGVISRIDNRLGILEEFHLLQAFLTHAAEILLMGTTQTGKDTDGRLYDIA